MSLADIRAPVRILPKPAEAPFVLTDGGVGNAPRCASDQRFEVLFADMVRALGPSAETLVAVDNRAGPSAAVTSYAGLERLANRMAHCLHGHGVAPGDRVGILLKGTPETYAAMLAILQLGAVFVPLDAVFPAERIAFILADSAARFALCDASNAHLLPAEGITRIDVDAQRQAIAALSSQPFERQGLPPDTLCYIIYTSGTTGRPKGVQIDHAMLANFVLVAAETYGIAAGARMYQGLTIAFDFSVEEIWVPLFSRATLVPGPADGNLVGEDLADFLKAERVTALCCVPTLLASIGVDLPQINWLLVSGEACPRDLVQRWWRPDRTLLNAYGPTEVTVTATLGRPRPGEPVTIGRPLPTYAVLIRDAETGAILPRGETGEIVLAGIGVSRGYLNRPDLTVRAFLPDSVGVAHNASHRLYRTGDLGRVNEAGEVEYLGRIDSQVKIRGYRIELTEIESVLMQVPGIAQAVVDKIEREPGQPELAAWYSLHGGADGLEPLAILAAARAQLPAFMVPVYLQQLAAIPMLASGKADRKALPAPRQRVAGLALAEHVAAATATERLIAEIVAPLAGVANASVTADLFDGLGLNSLLIARAASEVRRRQPGANLAMKDFYLSRTIRGVATLVDDRAQGPAAQAKTVVLPHRASRTDFWMTGLHQALAMLLLGWVSAELVLRALLWTDAATSLADLYGRSVAMGLVTFAYAAVLPIALKWLLIGRARPERIPLWTPHYFRFWLVKSLIRSNPLVLFAGTPLFNVYLRLLGARIGAHAQILAASVPGVPDLLEVGERAIINRTATYSCYRGIAGWIETGPVRIGAGASVGEFALLDIDTAIGADAALAHSSTLATGQCVPAGQSWHGAPAEPAPHDYRADTRNKPPAWRKAGFIAAQIALLFGFTMPMPFVLLVGLDWLGPVSYNALDPFAVIGPSLPMALMVFFGFLLLGLLLVGILPRLANAFLRTGRAYPLYGFHHFLARWLATFANVPAFNTLFGDSALILNYVRYVGVDIPTFRGNQTGSNFGLLHNFDNPFFCQFAPGVMASDGLTMINHVYSSQSLTLHASHIGRGSFLGNAMLIPPGHRLGDNVLIATKTMVPTHGGPFADTGLLGSPAFAIPRSTERDQAFAHFRHPDVLAANLARKTRSNVVTIGHYLATRFLLFYFTWSALAFAFELYPVMGSLILPLATGGLLLLTLASFIALEHASRGFRPLTPQTCSIYQPYYWFHERYWKLNYTMALAVLAGTPFMPLVLRLTGVKMGQLVFDDGAAIIERSMTHIGDGAVLNAGAVLQGHSLEDGVFKSDHVRIGTGCSVGPRAFIHYGTTMEDGACIDADSFLMKGETIGAGAHWGGNPARAVGS